MLTATISLTVSYTRVTSKPASWSTKLPRRKKNECQEREGKLNGKWKVIGSPLRIAGLEFILVATHVDKSFAIFLFFVRNLAPSALHNNKVYKQKPN